MNWREGLTPRQIAAIEPQLVDPVVFGGATFGGKTALMMQEAERTRAEGRTVHVFDKSAPFNDRTIPREKMNKTERAFAQYAEIMRRSGRWYFVSDHEPFSIKLAPRTFYRPDFFIWRDDRQRTGICLVDVKGTKGEGPYIREDANLKLKMVAKLFPCFRVIVTWKLRGHWHEKLIRGE